MDRPLLKEQMLKSTESMFSLLKQISVWLNHSRPKDEPKDTFLSIRKRPSVHQPDNRLTNTNANIIFVHSKILER